MEAIEYLIGPMDRFHVKHGGYEFSLHKVLFYLYALDEWHYARQESDNALTSDKRWNPWTLKRNI